MQSIKTHCGYIAIIGRPNVGKSTLLNAILGKKLSITSRKPQTTRHRITGIKTEAQTQFVFVDTPGLHQGETGTLNRYLNRAALSALREVDVIVWVIDASSWREDDDYVAKKLNQAAVPVIVAVNKTDLLKDYAEVLPEIQKLSTQWPEFIFVPMAAKKGFHIDKLLQVLREKLPISPLYFADNQLTDRSDTFVAAELIREKLVRLLGQELPYATMVGIEQLEKRGEILHVYATIWVEREGQKPIVIGKQGAQLKKISTQARLSLQQYFNCQVFLQVWVKVKRSWSEDERIIHDYLR